VWEALPHGANDDYEVTNTAGKVHLEGFRRFRSFIKRVEHRGFPAGGYRTPTGRWRDLLRQLRNRNAFGRTWEERVKIIRDEIESMTDREQGALYWDLPTFFRDAAREFVRKQSETLEAYLRGSSEGNDLS
jgi:hypothetical protein